MFVSTLLTSIRRIVEFAEQFQRGMTGIERFNEIMKTEPEIVDSPNAKTLSNVRGEVKFCNVSFSYESEEMTRESHHSKNHRDHVTY